MLTAVFMWWRRGAWDTQTYAHAPQNGLCLRGSPNAKKLSARGKEDIDYYYQSFITVACRIILTILSTPPIYTSNATSYRHNVPQKIRSEPPDCGQAVLCRTRQNPALRLRLPAIHPRRVATDIRHEDVL